jgi:hypothetical protein
MENQMPLRWIEEAEAREVLAAALFERAIEPSRFRSAWRAVSRQLRQCLPAIDWARAMPLQAQPALVRPATGERGLGPRSDDGCCCPW